MGYGGYGGGGKGGGGKGKGGGGKGMKQPAYMDAATKYATFLHTCGVMDRAHMTHSSLAKDKRILSSFEAPVWLSQKRRNRRFQNQNESESVKAGENCDYKKIHRCTLQSAAWRERG